jgi:hypothetical protein
VQDLGGIGKTELAFACARAFASAYFLKFYLLMPMDSQRIFNPNIYPNAFMTEAAALITAPPAGTTGALGREEKSPRDQAQWRNEGHRPRLFTGLQNLGHRLARARHPEFGGAVSRSGITPTRP